MLRDVPTACARSRNVRLTLSVMPIPLPLRGELITLYGYNIGLSREPSGTSPNNLPAPLISPPKPSPTKGLVTVGRLPQCDRRRPTAQPGAWKCRLGTRARSKAGHEGSDRFPREEQHQGLPDRDRLFNCATGTATPSRARQEPDFPPSLRQRMLSVPEEFQTQVGQALKISAATEPCWSSSSAFGQYPASGTGRTHLRRPRRAHQGGSRRVALAFRRI